MSFTNLLVLIEFSIVLLIESFSLILILRLLFGIAQKYNRPKFNISIPIVLNMVCWTLAVASCLPYVCLMLINWSPEASTKNTSLVFWSGMWSNCFNTTVSFSVFFLTLDRIFCIKFAATYLRKQKKALVSTEIIVLVISFFINVYAYLEELPIPETTICLHFACTVVKTGSKVYVITKIFGGGITILAGFIFLAILFNSFNQSAASAANQSGKKQRANQIAGLMVCTEIAFNFLPQVGVLLLLQTTGIIIAPYVGPYNVLLNSFDVAIAALMYSTTLKKFTKRDSTLVDNIARKSSHVAKSKYSQFSVHDKQLAENVTDMMFNEICELNDIEQEIVEEENFEIDLHAVSEATEDEISDFEATSSRQKPIPSPLTLQNNNLSNPNKEIEPEDPSSRSLSSAANKPV